MLTNVATLIQFQRRRGVVDAYLLRRQLVISEYLEKKVHQGCSGMWSTARTKTATMRDDA